MKKKLPPFPVPADLTSEEDVKIKFLLPFLESRGYQKSCIDFNKAIEVQEGRKSKTIFADAVVYTTASKTTPLIVCETKPPEEPLTRKVRDQAISYARLLPRIAPLALVTNGHIQVYQTLSKNQIPELPPRSELSKDFLRFVVSSDIEDALRTEAKHGLFIIDDVNAFKRILKSCHDEIRNNEGSNPAEAFDEMSKVLFCKMHEEREHPGEKNRFRLAVYDKALKSLNTNVVRTIWDETKKDARFQGLFDPKSEITLNDRTVRKIIEMFEGYDLSLTAFDVKGEAFEYFLGETFTGGLGQYFTPRNVVEFIVDASDPKIGQKLVDPFCGTGGFLIYAFEVVSEKIKLQDFSDDEKKRWKAELSDRCIFGSDWAERTSIACKMNMIVHGDGSSGIVMHHGLTDVPGKIEEEKFDFCLTNPPFGSFENDPAILRAYQLGNGRKSVDRVVLAVERSLRLVKPGGMVAIVVIDGILNNDSQKDIRDYIRTHSWVRAVISLPETTFQGYHARAKTSILFLEKKPAPDASGAQKKAFVSILKNSGYAANGDQVAGSELPDVLLDLKAFFKGKESNVHKASRVVTLSERLDAEFYRQGVVAEIVDATSITARATALSAGLSGASTELATVTAAINACLGGAPTKPVRLGSVFVQRRNAIPVDRSKKYRLLGVRWWGAGTFVREEPSGKDIKANRLFTVSEKALIYNRLFAFRGSFAVVPKGQADCHVSSEFPTFVTKPDVEDPELLTTYVNYCLNSPQYLYEIDRLSTGSTKTSRNRFKEERFLALRVAIPTQVEDIKKLVSLMDKAGKLRATFEQVKGDLDELTGALATLLPVPSAEAAAREEVVAVQPPKHKKSRTMPASEKTPKPGPKKGRKSKKR